MGTVGRITISFNEEYKREFDFLQNIPNKSRFICEAIKKCIDDENDLSVMEIFIKSHIQELKN